MKRSILFGVLAMFAVSALSIQNLNAQNEDDKTNNNSTQAIIQPKDKPQDNGEKTIKKDGDNKKPTQAINETKPKPQVDASKDADKNSQDGKKDGTIQKEDPKAPAMRSANPNGKNDVKANKTDKPKRPKLIKEKKAKNDAKAEEKKAGEKQQGNEVFIKKDGKPSSKHKMVKDQKAKNDAKVSEKKDDQNANGNGKKAGMVKPGKAEDKVQSGVGKENSNQKEVDPTSKNEPSAPINNVVRPKQKVKEGTGKQNNNGTL